MLELYTYGTSNGQRASIMLEESGLHDKAIKVDLERGEQKTPNYLKINPAGQIPALVDLSRAGGKPIVVCQSGAIILHVAERTGKLIPRDPSKRQLAYQWFMQAMTDVAPASGIMFVIGSMVPEATNNTRKLFEQRLLGHLRNCDRRLAEAQFLADEYSIADVALYPTVSFRREAVQQAGDLPYLTRWLAAMDAKPAVQRGMAVPKD
jgi:GST-like protein